MYARSALLAAVLAATPLAHAADETVSQLAHETGLTERNVRMVLGARTAYPEYMLIFNRVDRQFKERIGEVRYEELTGRKSLPSEAETARDVRVAAR